MLPAVAGLAATAELTVELVPGGGKSGKSGSGIVAVSAKRPRPNAAMAAVGTSSTMGVCAVLGVWTGIEPWTVSQIMRITVLSVDNSAPQA